MTACVVVVVVAAAGALTAAWMVELVVADVSVAVDALVVDVVAGVVPADAVLPGMVAAPTTLKTPAAPSAAAEEPTVRRRSSLKPDSRGLLEVMNRSIDHLPPNGLPES